MLECHEILHMETKIGLVEKKNFSYYHWVRESDLHKRWWIPIILKKTEMLVEK